MSFGTPDELFPLIEDLMQTLFKKVLNLDIPTKFRRETYAWAIEHYGCDKPDLRFGMPLVRLDDIAARSTFSVFRDQLASGGIVKGIRVEGGDDISRKSIDDYTKFVGSLGIKGLAWMKRGADGVLSSSIVKFFDEGLQKELIDKMDLKPGDLVFMVADQAPLVHKGLDHLRRKLAADRNLIDNDRFEFLWVTDFPLFQWNEEEKRLENEHHPFTSPLLEDIHLIDSDPLKARSSSYDLVLNGFEIGSGSQRIHDDELQQKIFTLVGLTPEELTQRFGFFVEALCYGTPPHLGIGLGFDRIIMIMTKTDNIRDVIAFPKTQKASDVMMDCPSNVGADQLDILSLAVTI
jgi:aspartyl-tRNA synthetase